jgi:hypothetical protein
MPSIFTTGLLQQTFLQISDYTYYIVGLFDKYNGVTTSNIVKLNSLGAVDTSFSEGLFNGIATAIDGDPIEQNIPSDMDIFVGGDFDKWDTTTHSGIIKLDRYGDVDTDFVTGDGFAAGGFGPAVRAVYFDKTSILVGGGFTTYDGVASAYLAKLDSSDGSLDGLYAAYGAPNNQITSITKSGAGNYAMTGTFTTWGFLSRNRIVVLNSDYTINTGYSLGTGFNSASAQVIFDSSGKMYVIGNFSTYQGTTVNRICRINTNGSLDTGYSSGLNGQGATIALNSAQDRVYLGGAFTEYNSTTANRIVATLTNGSIDTGFDYGTGFNSGVRKIKLDPDDKVIVLGGFTTYKSTTVNGIVRLNSDGSIDTTFDIGSGLGDGGGAGQGFDCYIAIDR